MAEQTPDTELLRLYRSTGDRSAFSELYRRYVHLVMGMSLKYLKDKDEAKDAASQVFEKLLKELKHAEIQNFRGWLGFVTRNHCISILRKKGVENERNAALRYFSSPTMESGEEERLISRESDYHRLETCLKELNPDQEKCLRLFYIEECSYAQVAERTGYTMNAVKSHLQNGKRNLKILLEKNVHIPK
ncbi:MAG: RNA polymerase sigma factor [Bacteroidia bacterium]|nr:RNA polymerase sigma factor [Bacteroidia bacterium]